MPAVSVVMPVYNTEEYVAKAIESILNQTFTDFEFLIIDNGATDGSGKIIDSYAAKDERIRVLRNEKNVFIAEARNQALDQVSGEYLYLIDSDDWVLPDMLEVMYSRAKEINAQYVVAGYYMDYYVNGKYTSYENCPDDRNYEQAEFRRNAVDYLTRTLLTVPWNKLYSISYLREHQIRFRNTKLEDHHFNMDILMDVERVCMVSKPFYHYYRSRQGTDSELVYNQFLNQKKREHLAHTLEVYKHWGVDDKETMGKLADYHMGRLVQCVTQTVVNSQLSKVEKKAEIRTILDDQLTGFAIENAKNDSLKIAILSLPIRMKSQSLCYAMGWFVGEFKEKFSGLYYKMRAQVAQNAKESAKQ